MKTFRWPFLLLLFSCNIQQQVDKKVAVTKIEMDKEIVRLRTDFTAQYQIFEKKEIDSLRKQSLYDLNFSLADTDNYLDSLRRQLDELDDMDTKNVELIKTTFIYNGAGDSLIKKFTRCTKVAKKVAATDEQKMTIKKISDNLFNEPTEKWKEQMFGLTSPLGAIMILYGIQTEMFRIGSEALKQLPLTDY